jgi:hypothetical protein
MGKKGGRLEQWLGCRLTTRSGPRRMMGKSRIWGYREDANEEVQSRLFGSRMTCLSNSFTLSMGAGRLVMRSEDRANYE